MFLFFLVGGYAGPPTTPSFDPSVDPDT